jgi:protein-tyrosine phosphatase
LSLLGALAAWPAVVFGGLWWFVAWPAAAFWFVALAYFSASPRLLGKHQDGSLSPAHVLVLLPYFAIVWTRWWLTNRLTREPVWNEVVPGLFLGRFPAAGQVPEAAQLVVDLTSEFPRAASIGADRQYICVPSLDYETPPAAEFLSAARELAARSVPMYVHCAFGHGRSAAMVAAILLRRRSIRSIPEAVSLLKAARPGVGLVGPQLDVLQRLEAQLLAP